MATARDQRYDVPLYGIADAASHLRMSKETLGRWVRRGDLLNTVEPSSPRGARLPFVALAEAQFLWQLRMDGLTLPAIAEGMAAVRRELGPRMLQAGRLAHDGRDVLVNISDDESRQAWERARDRQGGIDGVIERALKPIVWAEDGYPARVHLVAYQGVDVIADPEYAFGQPILAESGVRAEDIIDLFRAGDPIAAVADEFAISPGEVEAIVRTHVLAA